MESRSTTLFAARSAKLASVVAIVFWLSMSGYTTTAQSTGMTMSMSFVRALLTNNGFTPQPMPKMRRPTSVMNEKVIMKQRTVVETAEGSVMGRREDNGVNKPFLAFRGVPYAKPPVGDLRFKSPERMAPWEGVKMTIEYQESCLGYLMRMLVGEEDCLYLNVFIPEGAKEETVADSGLPVIFFIPGGAFVHGGEFTPFLYHPGTFTDRGAIFISVNYRLGALGFLSMDDGVLPGNYGLKDMIMGLRWVRRNIRRFGGDPDKVTIMGESAGGVAVHALTLSPAAQGLFSGAISMSGSIFTLWGHHATGKPTAKHLGEQLGCPMGNSRQMLECLRQRGAKEITSAVQSFFFLGSRYGTPFAPVVDSRAVDPVLPEHPLKLLRDRNFNQVPHIFGNLPKEMNLFLPGVMYDAANYEKLTNDWDNECGMIAYNFLSMPEMNPTPRETSELCRKARGLYFPDGNVIDSDGSADDITTFASDIYFASATYAAALLHARFSSAPVFYYSWEHTNEGALSVLGLLNILADSRLQLLFMNSTRTRDFRLHAEGSHTDELTLLFDPPNFQKLSKNDLKTKNFAATMLSSFWNTRKPAVNGVEWPRFDAQTQKYVTFQTNPQIKGFLIKPDRLELFANWYDVMERRFAMLPDKPSLTRLLGFRTPTSSIGGGSNANEIFRDNRSVGQKRRPAIQQVAPSSGQRAAAAPAPAPRRSPVANLVAAVAAAQQQQKRRNARATSSNGARNPNRRLNSPSF